MGKKVTVDNKTYQETNEATSPWLLLIKKGKVAGEIATIGNV